MHKTIVYIEDDLEMIELVKLILDKRGYELIGVIGGRKGIDTLIDKKPDLILLDLMMPDVDGWEVYQQIKSNETLKTIPVIIITAKAQPIDRVLGLEIAKVDEYLTKPFKPQELINIIEHHLSKQSE